MGFSWVEQSVAAVVTMVAIGDGARERVASQIRSLGANLIGINQGSLTIGAVRLGAGAAQRRSEADAHDIEAEVPGIVAVAPWCSPGRSSLSGRRIGR